VNPEAYEWGRLKGGHLFGLGVALMRALVYEIKGSPSLIASNCREGLLP
jgi:hypothetical protein